MSGKDCGCFTLKFNDDSDLALGFGDVQLVHTDNYEDLYNKPKIESHTLIGDKSFKQLGLDTLSVQEIEAILYLD